MKHKRCPDCDTRKVEYLCSSLHHDLYYCPVCDMEYKEPLEDEE